jgi:hypothetical protein
VSPTQQTLPPQQSWAAQPGGWDSLFNQSTITAVSTAMTLTGVQSKTENVLNSLNSSNYLNYFKIYFNITHQYVRRKLVCLLLPLPSQPMDMDEDPHALRTSPGRRPDLYLPAMGLITFILLHALTKGVLSEGSFHPDFLYHTASVSSICWIIESLIIKLICYLFSNFSINFADIFAIVGYKFIHLSASTTLILLLLSVGVWNRTVWFLLLAYAIGTAGWSIFLNFKILNFSEFSNNLNNKIIFPLISIFQFLWIFILFPAFVAQTMPPLAQAAAGGGKRIGGLTPFEGIETTR